MYWPNVDLRKILVGMVFVMRANRPQHAIRGMPTLPGGVTNGQVPNIACEHRQQIDGIIAGEPCKMTEASAGKDSWRWELSI